MYEQGTQRFGGRPGARGPGAGTGRRSAPRQERTRLVQLAVCMVLFLTLFVGRGIFPAGLRQVRGEVLTLISSDTDFRAAFSRLGEALAGENAVFGELGEFCAAVFGGTGEEKAQPISAPAPRLTSLLRSEQRFLGGGPDRQALTDHYLPEKEVGELLSTLPAPEPPAEPPAEEPKEAVTAVGTVLLRADYDGEAPPEGYTMDQLSLGGLEFAVPVLGKATSGYGYRNHPINGRRQFHGGLDIRGKTGDPIRAFAAGRVEYVGENDSYGLYFQLDHGNGVKSFYAHCKSVCVKKGQTVALGEQVAEVGSSGASTGPHLHLELKCGKLRMDPAYYVETLSA